MNDLSRMTWPEAKALLARDPVAFVPIGSTEPHGPHMALDVDVTIAVAQVRRACELLEAEGVATLVVPPLAYGLTNFTEGFAGRITLRPGTLFSLVEDVVESLGQEGVRAIVLSNAHLEPAHVAVLRAVAEDYPGPEGEGLNARPDKPRVVLGDVTRRRWAERLGDEFQSGECHAGSYETSIVLAADPGGVRDGERASLEPVELGLIAGMQAGKKSFAELGSDAAYCGDPAAASAEEGRDLIERLAQLHVELVRATWPERFGG